MGRACTIKATQSRRNLIGHGRRRALPACAGTPRGGRRVRPRQRRAARLRAPGCIRAAVQPRAQLGCRAERAVCGAGAAAVDARNACRSDDLVAGDARRVRYDPADPRGHQGPGAAPDGLSAAADLVCCRADGAAHLWRRVEHGPRAYPAPDGLDGRLRGHWRRADGAQGGQIDGAGDGRRHCDAQHPRHRACALFKNPAPGVHHFAACKRRAV